MITDSFDTSTESITHPRAFIGEQGKLFDTCILTFSHEIMAHAVEALGCAEVGCIGSVRGSTPIYAFERGGRTYGLFNVFVGSAMAANSVIELNWAAGATKFIMFGSCGSLVGEKTGGKYIIPTKAYRDEGMSYHYAPPADYIEIKNAPRIKAIFDGLGAPNVAGGVWTTDAFYRETYSERAKRVSEGCIAVDMELAGVQAVCDFHGFELYAFLTSGDVLDSPVYTPEGLHEANHSLEKLYLALKIAEIILTPD